MRYPKRLQDFISREDRKTGTFIPPDGSLPSKPNMFMFRLDERELAAVHRRLMPDLPLERVEAVWAVPLVKEDWLRPILHIRDRENPSNHHNIPLSLEKGVEHQLRWGYWEWQRQRPN